MSKKDQPENGLYWCRKCEALKPETAFYKRGNGKLYTPCRECKDAANKARAQAAKPWLKPEAKEKYNAYKREWEAKNQGKVAEYRERFKENNPEANNEACRKWYAENRAFKLAQNRKQELRREKAFVPWADKEKIKAIYDRAKELTDMTGVPCHVDHIIPLRGKYVSGLHVETNLQILTAPDNARKRNIFQEHAA